MDTQAIVKRGLVLNYVLLVITAVYWIFSEIITNISSGTLDLTVTDSNIGALRVVIIIIQIAYIVISIVCLIMAIILKSKNKNNDVKVDGIGLLIGSAAVSAVFSLLRFMIGIVVFVLSGMSIKKLRDSGNQENFRNRLNNNM